KRSGSASSDSTRRVTASVKDGFQAESQTSRGNAVAARAATRMAASGANARAGELKPAETTRVEQTAASTAENRLRSGTRAAAGSPARAAHALPWACLGVPSLI